MATRRKRKKPGRKPGPRCVVLRCKRRPVRRGLCNTHLLREADAAFSRFIRARDGACVKCGGRDYLQTMHIISRRYRQVRWNSNNALAGCRKCHTYFEHRPLEWQRFINDRANLGMGKTWDARRREALDGTADWRDLAQDWIGEGYPA